MNLLEEFNARLLQEIEQRKATVDASHGANPTIAYSSYFLADFKDRVTRAIRNALDDQSLGVQIEPIDRSQFGGDFAIKVPELLKQGGPKNYIEKFVPQIAAALKADKELGAAIVRIETKGIYANIALSNDFYLKSLDAVLERKGDFGRNDLESSRSFVIDYSSPNAAKQLHAGHIRSTIVGHVLGNLHEANGAHVYRVNHINDIGGFGFLLEGYRRWDQTFAPDLPPNDRLLALYAIRRFLEKVSDHEGPLETLSAQDREKISSYLGSVGSMAEFREKYSEFCGASDRAYSRLEAGEKEEVASWRQMIDWSMADFEKFYVALGINIDFVIGESFYLTPGNDLVDKAIQDGKAVKYTPELAEREKLEVAKLLAETKIEPQVHDSLVQAIQNDIGAVVVPLDGHRRFVVRRADGRSIYATRDLGALKVRRDLFGASDITYVVGQEQREHFGNLFEAGKNLQIGIEGIALKHIYFGFYVDAGTKRKLSSREGAANVHALLAESVRYFHNRYDDDKTISGGERQRIAQQLAVGSLVFNDLKKDMRGAVEVDTANIEATIAGFEKSGGAYVVYAACRARGILRKHGKELPKACDVDSSSLNEQEIGLITQIHRMPERIADAARNDDPSILIRQLLDLASAFNTYYAKYPVIKDGVVNEHRLLITAAVSQALQNGLRICHVECPDRI